MNLEYNFKNYFDNEFNNYLDVIIVQAKMLDYKIKYFLDQDVGFRLDLDKYHNHINIIIPYYKDPESFDVYVYKDSYLITGDRLGEKNFKKVLTKTLELL